MLPVSVEDCWISLSSFIIGGTISAEEGRVGVGGISDKSTFSPAATAAITMSNCFTVFTYCSACSLLPAFFHATAAVLYFCCCSFNLVRASWSIVISAVDSERPSFKTASDVADDSLTSVGDISFAAKEVI